MESSVSLNITAGSGSIRTVYNITRSGNGLARHNTGVVSADVRETDRVDISTAGKEAGNSGEARSDRQQSPSLIAPDSTAENLSIEDYLKLSYLKNRDREVRAHEQAHLATAGQYATGGAIFTYQVGPDGNRYAVGGEVPVDISSGVTSEETLRKMDRIRAAALAPAEPSAADRQIAAQAMMKASQAQREILLSRQPEISSASSAKGQDEAGEGAPPADDPAGSRQGPAPGRVHVSVMIQAYNEMLARN